MKAALLAAVLAVVSLTATAQATRPAPDVRDNGGISPDGHWQLLAGTSNSMFVLDRHSMKPLKQRGMYSATVQQEFMKPMPFGGGSYVTKLTYFYRVDCEYRQVSPSAVTGLQGSRTIYHANLPESWLSEDAGPGVGGLLDAVCTEN